MPLFADRRLAPCKLVAAIRQAERERGAVLWGRELARLFHESRRSLEKQVAKRPGQILIHVPRPRLRTASGSIAGPVDECLSVSPAWTHRQVRRSGSAARLLHGLSVEPPLPRPPP